MFDRSLPPTGPRWYAEPKIVRLSVESHKPAAFSDERMVSIRLNGETTWAVVLSEDFNVNSSKVRGMIVGESSSGTHVLIVLRPASMGRTVLKLPMDKVAEVELEEEPAQ